MFSSLFCWLAAVPAARRQKFSPPLCSIRDQPTLPARQKPSPRRVKPRRVAMCPLRAWLHPSGRRKSLPYRAEEWKPCWCNRVKR
ncbi:hypothetical protein ADN00_09180 [Ornatilinea apprima]|uniref:Uncharacterized protein n=1 Tax=Ornatilinea apprima TaxID=1134406 RepID=A0A0P6Y6T2_9CHLR|nr:hypothetical protein ADN00_09180 [Ornatilinea apprima]